MGMTLYPERYCYIFSSFFSTVPLPETAEPVVIKDDNTAVVILSILLAVVLLALIVSAVFYVYHSSNGKNQSSTQDAAIKYTNGDSKNVTMPNDMNIDNPNYMTAKDYNTSEHTA